MDAVPSLPELAESATAAVESESDNDTFNECMVRPISLYSIYGFRLAPIA